MISKKLIAAAGNAGGGGGLYVEDVFSTYLYKGNGTSQTITNGIDLDGEGGLVWIKGREGSAADHLLFDTDRGATNAIITNSTSSTFTNANTLTSFSSSGFSVGSYVYVNHDGSFGSSFPTNFASWTFRKAEKFFDVVTYTGTGTTRTVSHNLGSTPAVIIVKRLDADVGWPTYHEANGNTGLMYLNTTAAKATSSSAWGSTSPTDTEFTVGTNVNNINGGQFVAYLFASDDGSESIIKCGSVTPVVVDGAWVGDVNLGWEAQYVLAKSVGTSDWRIFDSMRGLNNTQYNFLEANTSDAEFNSTGGTYCAAKSTGFELRGVTGEWIYIAIRRPMKTPESGTEVFNLSTASAGTAITNNFAADSWFGNFTEGNGGNNAHIFASRLTGLKWLQTATNALESTASNTFYWDSNTEFTNSQFGGGRIEYFLKRATGFFDVVAYTGTGATHVINHNLGVTPEFIIVKGRSFNSFWLTWHTGYPDNYMLLNSNVANQPSGRTIFDSEDSSSFTLGSNYSANGSGQNFIAYLFTTLAGVSKVGSYTGTGANLNVDCGFSAGARFILIKRTDSTGDWYVWDSARGIVAGNDPYLLLNTTAADVTSTDYIDPLASGFTVTSSAPAALNASGGVYIFLAIA